MNHNLTPKQLDSLRWLIKQIEARELGESFNAGEGSGTPSFFIVNFRGEVPEYLDLGVLDALVVDGALVANSKKFTVVNRAYEIIKYEERTSSNRFLTGANYLAKLRDNLIDYFNETELHNLAFDLGINYDALPGQGTSDKAREIVDFLNRRKRIGELIQRGKRLRAEIDWSED